LHSGDDVNTTNYVGMTALILAAGKGKIKTSQEKKNYKN
jgi:hypothetical protein